ncbi:hypothetical protein Tco_0327248 [Tanacetum coccineum]
MKAPLLQRLSAQGAKIMKWNQGENLKCPFCKDCEDSHNHLFFQCPEVAKVWNKLKAKGKLQSAPDTLDRVVDLIAARPFNKNIWRILQRLIISSMAKLNTLIVKKTCAVLTVAKEWGFSWDNKRLIKIFGMGVWVMDVCTFWLMASCVSSQDFADHNTGGQSSFVGLILRREVRMGLTKGECFWYSDALLSSSLFDSSEDVEGYGTRLVCQIYSVAYELGLKGIGSKQQKSAVKQAKGALSVLGLLSSPSIKNGMSNHCSWSLSIDSTKKAKRSLFDVFLKWKKSDDSEKDIVPFPLNDSVEGTYGSLKEGTDTKIK